MTDLRKAAEMALEVMEELQFINASFLKCDKAAEALRQALSNEFNPDWNQVEALQESLREHMAEIQRLRQALALEMFSEVNQEIEEALKQPKREWVGLTDEDFWKVMGKIPLQTEITDEFLLSLAKAIEAKLKEKNT